MKVAVAVFPLAGKSIPGFGTPAAASAAGAKSGTDHVFHAQRFPRAGPGGEKTWSVPDFDLFRRGKGAVAQGELEKAVE